MSFSIRYIRNRKPKRRYEESVYIHMYVYKYVYMYVFVCVFFFFFFKSNKLRYRHHIRMTDPPNSRAQDSDADFGKTSHLFF